MIKKLVDWFEELLWARAIKDVFENPEYLDLPTVELETIRDTVVPKLEKHNIKRAYPNMTDGEVAAYILGFNEHEKVISKVQSDTF